MNIRVFAFICVLFSLEVVLAQEKKKDYEDVYGEMQEQDVQKDDYYDESDTPPENASDDRSPEPVNVAKLLSENAVLHRKVGEQLFLPCVVSGPPGQIPVRVWKKENQIIFQEDVNILGLKNLNVVNGTLEVALTHDSDFGTYTCELMVSPTFNPSVVYQVIANTPAQITALYTENNKTVFSEGETLNIYCIAEGNPKPTVSWHKVSERLGTAGPLLTIPALSATDGGFYRCLADNIVKPDHKHIEIFVRHAPIVTLKEYVVNADHEKDAELICTVDAYPHPVAEWRKNGEVLSENTDKFKIAYRNVYSKNTLTIKNINENDFGSYSCIVRNELGTVIKNVTLVKTPVVRKLEKNTSDANNEVILQWKVESKQPILNHELQYRKKGENQWRNLSPSINPSTNDVYLIKQTLKDLDPGVYETRARSKNHHGWSQYSDITPFDAIKHVNHHHKSKHNKKEPKTKSQDPGLNTPAQHRSEGQVGESISGSVSTHPSTLTVLLTLTSILCFHIRHQIC